MSRRQEGLGTPVPKTRAEIVLVIRCGLESPTIVSSHAIRTPPRVSAAGKLKKFSSLLPRHYLTISVVKFSTSVSWRQAMIGFAAATT